MSQELHDAGLGKRRQVLGDEYVDRALAGVDALTADFQKIVNEYCWGAVWTRGALSDRQRSLNNLCILAALNRQHEFRLHLHGALRNGCTVEEIRDTLLQIAVYCGIPAGVEAFRIAREVLAEKGITPGPAA
ncbi:MAG: carboxymuconolactone decarboxylase family protein [Gammaproteobacteria bacterium]